MGLESTLQRAAVAALAALCALCTPSRALPHGGGWVPSGAWSSPAAFGTVQHVGVNPWPATGWTDYSVDPWATQVLRKKPSYASLYPWVQKPVYHQPLHVHAPAHHHSHHHHSEYAGWAKIPVLDHESAGQWVAWVPEEFEDFVIVRKEKKKKVEIEEDEEEPEPPKPKKKKVKTTIEEEEETPEEPSKKKTTIVEEEKTEPKKKVTETKVEEEQTPSIKTSSVMKTETVQASSTVAQPVSVPAPTPVDVTAATASS